MQALTDPSSWLLPLPIRNRAANGESLDSLLPALRHGARGRPACYGHASAFDVQLIGGMALHEGQIAEMKPARGKTLVSTLAGYLNALPAKACTSLP